MTLNELHKRLGKLIEQGHGRCRVSVNKSTFQDNREADGCVILPVYQVAVDWIPEFDDSGYIGVNKDGSERGRMTVVLGGGTAEPLT
jgi:hypothetical protein